MPGFVSEEGDMYFLVLFTLLYHTLLHLWVVVWVFFLSFFLSFLFFLPLFHISALKEMAVCPYWITVEYFMPQLLDHKIFSCEHFVDPVVYIAVWQRANLAEDFQYHFETEKGCFSKQHGGSASDSGTNKQTMKLMLIRKTGQDMICDSILRLNPSSLVTACLNLSYLTKLLHVNIEMMLNSSWLSTETTWHNWKRSDWKNKSHHCFCSV